MAGPTTIFQMGVHGSRPAASSGCVWYWCTTHSKVYRSDGSAWADLQDLSGFTTGGLVDPMTTRGDMIVRNASNVTARLAKGSADTFLGSDGTDLAFAAVTDAKLSTSDITTNDVSTSKHGFAPKLPNDATKYLDGTGAYTVPAGGGGGGSTSFLGYNAAGASWETLTTNRHYYKKFTMAAAGWVDVQAYLRPSTDNVAYMIGEIAADNAGEIGILRAAQALGTTYLSNSSSMPGSGRWVSVCKAYLDAAGDYWGGFTNDQARFDLAYDGSGSDHTFTASLLTATGGYPTAWTITTGTRKYSIRIAVL